MTTNERQQSLAAARLACEWLRANIMDYNHEEWERLKCLIAEFKRLDENASRPRAGRPRIKNPKPKSLTQRRWRDKDKP
jgi:hypothetical protein